MVENLLSSFLDFLTTTIINRLLIVKVYLILNSLCCTVDIKWLRTKVNGSNTEKKIERVTDHVKK